MGPAGREVADGAGYLDAGDGGVVDRAVAGCGAAPVSGLAGQAAAICLLSDIIRSSFMSCLGIAVRVPPSMRRMSTPPSACWRPGSRPRRRPGCWTGAGLLGAAGPPLPGQCGGVGRVEIPGEGTVFTVRLPVRLAAAVREHARASGRTISSVAVQALEEFLSRAHGDRPSR